MKDEEKTREQLTDELLELRRRNAEIERMYEALKETQEWYRDLADNAKDLIQRVSADGRFLYVNRAWCDTLGYSEEDAASLSLFDIIHPESQAHCAEVFHRVISGHAVDGVEAVFVAKDGREIIVEGSANCMFVDGKPFATRGTFRDVTKRRQAEKELKKTKERYRTIFELCPGAIVLLDGEGNILDVNRRLCDWLDCEPEDIMGRNVSELPFLSEEGKVHVLEKLSQRISGEEVPVYEVDFATRGGEKRIGRIVGTAIRDEDGRAVQDLVMMADVTDVKKMDEALHGWEMRYRKTLDSLSDPIHVVDEELRFVLFNRAFREWHAQLGQKTDVIGQNLLDVLPFLPESVREEYNWVFETGEVLITERTLRVGDMEMDTEIRKIPISREGKTTQAVTVIRDITQHKQAERALRESEELYRTLVKTSPDAVTAIDLEGAITYVSQRTVELHGYSHDTEVLGKSAFELIIPEERDRMMINLQRIINEGVVRNIEFTMLRKDGTRFIGELSTALVKDADGEPKGFVGITRDITKRKQMAEALWRSEEELRESIIERRLMKTGKLASLGKLSAKLVHELSNPLNGALRYVRLLIDQIPESDLRRMYAEQACDGMMRMSRLIKGMSEFAKRSRAILSPRDISRSIERIISSFSDQIQAQKIMVETEFDRNISVVLDGDVEDIFVHLIKNAIQAMPDGGTLSVKAKMVSQQLFEARFSDTGPGIPSEVRDRIFDPFFTTKGFEQGVGLGLFISQEIAESHNGSIHLESESGKGTTFVVRLPMYKGSILVMDDEKYARDAAVEILSISGYRVAAAIDGAEAIRLYKEARDLGQPYDAVILDLVVPGNMGGKEVLQKLMEIDPEVKAIVSSGYSDDPMMSDFADHGFNGSIAKPYDMNELGKILHGVIVDGYRVPQV